MRSGGRTTHGHLSNRMATSAKPVKREPSEREVDEGKKVWGKEMIRMMQDRREPMEEARNDADTTIKGDSPSPTVPHGSICVSCRPEIR